MPHHRQIKKVAVIGAGTMGAGIAALCAQADIPVVLLDITKESADKAVERMLLGRFPAIEEPQKAELITTGELQEGLPLLKMCDWICEAVVEDLAVKRDTFKIIELHNVLSEVL
ncbi:MAG: 3-hydroxyacyl-CoA dehydrogenase NAD-binding domain-containing protein [Arenicellales bacterium]|nr:3-hydroxyacyl-CoA dehydrogenase NAD-binding domain-containing protein [Arenicellales bacterium]